MQESVLVIASLFAVVKSMQSVRITSEINRGDLRENWKPRRMAAIHRVILDRWQP
ncbi:uncharacterized protein Dmoj_GI26204 [Drosophila mojavensis]|uniref:Uncharacterized protein, isoform A n=1 Tax=Drosophila mojavensis TaxID=7230 RepID=A0A0Q9X330_DROMO|nr:uncharacterized protein Dmoj_GI25751, isoform A [Drosophila mojavensis]KRG07200.1 uncharacterized protein Dmoj_GI26088 [Drosophila mojavensis]KRG07897.1 uncharacterized protein Dmoj_GI26204 [Drosophila mojavensis]